MAVTKYEGIPEGLLALPAERLVEKLDGPSLFYLRGRREPALFISALLHGNEVSGWEALRRQLAEPGELPRSVILFIGNIEAAAAGVRTLPHQQDYNRIWSEEIGGPEGEMAAEVLAAVDAQPPLAALDFHNNTGRNPHYAIATCLREDSLGLAYLFADRAVYAEQPDTVQTRAFNDRCPAVAVELGPVGDPECVERALSFLGRCFELDEVPPPDFERLKLHRTLARVHIKGEVPFTFAGASTSDHTALTLTDGMEAVNFHSLAAGMEFGRAEADVSELIEVLDSEGRDVTDHYLRSDRGAILLEQPIIPAMYTTDPVVIRQDCLCYFMARVPLPL
jgi:hypothetical protein